jgi:hypothetical protein
MAIVGTNSYTTAAAYEAYAAERGIIVSNSTLDQDLILSADFIDTYYTFKGQELDATQAMSLPTDVVAIADISKAALKAVELQQAGRLSLDATVLAGGLIAAESKSLDGVGSKSVSYESGTQVTYKPRVPELDRLLMPFVKGSSGLQRG